MFTKKDLTDGLNPVATIEISECLLSEIAISCAGLTQAQAQDMILKVISKSRQGIQVEDAYREGN